MFRKIGYFFPVLEVCPIGNVETLSNLAGDRIQTTVVEQFSKNLTVSIEHVMYASKMRMSVVIWPKLVADYREMALIIPSHKT